MSFDLKHRQNKAFLNNNENLHQEDYLDDSQDDHEQDLPVDIGEILYKWEGPEFEVYEKSKRWYIIAIVFILGMVAYALYTNGPIMAITFILIGIVGYIYSQKQPRLVTFAITSKGVFADKELYLYDNIFSFWIFYEPTHSRVVSLHTKASMLPFVHIPFDDENPVELREMLLKNIPEIKQDPSLIDTLERVLRI
jgi:hypothetical protein